MTDCIHGLETAMCDVCSPRAVPEPIARTTVRTASAPRSKSVRAGAPKASLPGVHVNRAELRVFLVVAQDRLPEVLWHLGEQDWRSELGAATDPFRWPDASQVERPSDLVVLVATAATGELQFLAAANEPARRTAREHLETAGLDVRVLLQPAWWV